MRTTLVLDDDLLEKLEEYTGLSEKTAIVREAMKALIERESARAGSRGWVELLRSSSFCTPPEEWRSMILADTSVWVDHLRSGDAQLEIEMDRNGILMHPFCLG